MSPRAWVLNFDAEYELEAPRYTRARAMTQRVEDLARAFPLPLGDVVVSASDADLRLAGLDYEPRAWCPTALARKELLRVGLVLSDVPLMDALRAVNHRHFAHGLAASDDFDAHEIEALESVERLLDAGTWLLKRSFGVAGRGQRAIRGARLSDDDRRWIEASFGVSRGDTPKLYMERWVHIERELSVHGWARRGSESEVRSIREQVVVQRAFVSSGLARELGPYGARLIDAGHRVGAALVRAGYWGPFGVDAFVWRDERGRERLRAISEVNARFCMGWDDVDGWDP